MASTISQFGLVRPFDALLDETFAGELLKYEALAETPFADTLEDVRIERIWPARNSAVVIEWSFSLGLADRHSLYGIVEPGEGDAGVGACVSKESNGGGARVESRLLLGVHASVQRLGLTILSPDVDPVLTHLRDCLDVCTMVKRLKSTDSDGKSPLGVMGLRTRRLLGYRMGRRATIGYEVVAPDGTSRRVIGKTFRDDRGQAMLGRLSALRGILSKISDDRIQVPEPLTYLTDRKMAVCSALPESVGGPAGVDDLCLPTAMEALATLHRVPAFELQPFTPADEQGVLQRWQALLDLVATSLPPSFIELANTLAATASLDAGGEDCVIHRDFYGAQLLMGQDTCTILDLDTLAVGDPHVDVGNLIAHTLLERLQQGGCAEEWNSISQRVVTLYRQQKGTIRPRNLAYYTATSLFRLGAVHALRTTTGRYSQHLWEAGKQVLDRGPKRTEAAGRSHSIARKVVGGDVVPQGVGS